jgi:hypothetical protein
MNGGFWMTRLTFYSVVCLVLFVSSQAFGVTGMGLGVRAGVVANYDNPDLSFEEARQMDIDQLSMVGGHFRISSLPVRPSDQSLAAQRSLYPTMARDSACMVWRE